MIFKEYLSDLGMYTLREEDGNGGEVSTVSTAGVGGSGSSAIDDGGYGKGDSSGITQGDRGGTRSSDIATVDTCINFADEKRKKHLKALGTHNTHKKSK